MYTKGKKIKIFSSCLASRGKTWFKRACKKSRWCENCDEINWETRWIIIIFYSTIHPYDSCFLNGSQVQQLMLMTWERMNLHQVYIFKVNSSLRWWLFLMKYKNLHRVMHLHFILILKHAYINIIHKELSSSSLSNILSIWKSWITLFYFP